LAEERARATSAGMDGYLTKPLTLESFREALITHVGEDARSSIAPPPK
jgi:CheY-like chemotaxis protein